MQGGHCSLCVSCTELVATALEVLEGLTQLHAANTLHLDLRPSNILLDEWHVLVDAAKACATAPPDLTANPADFVEVVPGDRQEQMKVWFQQALGVRCCLVRQQPGSRKPISPSQASGPGKGCDQDPGGHIGCDIFCFSKLRQGDVLVD
ncbi:hypothetical protein WJX79_006247 [Trebouxia sp. C0005]